MGILTNKKVTKSLFSLINDDEWIKMAICRSFALGITNHKILWLLRHFLQFSTSIPYLILLSLNPYDLWAWPNIRP
jgi:hypothetical protein